MRVVIENLPEEVLRFSAETIINRIINYVPIENHPFTLVLPNPTPAVLYLYILLSFLSSRFKYLVEAYQNGRVSFRNVVFFQLEEYCGIDKNDPDSFAFQLYEHFFKFVDALPENVYFLNGKTTDANKECECFEAAIKEKGGLTFACVEVDSEASIGGNAPGSSLDSYTRMKTLTSLSIHDRCHTRNGEQDIEYSDIGNIQLGRNRVLTMGMGTLKKCKEVYALFLGSHSARSLNHVVQGCISNMFPASVLQLHPSACVLCDRFSMCTLRYTDVAYFTGIRDNYRLFYKDEVTDFRSFVLPTNPQNYEIVNETEIEYRKLRCRSPSALE